MKQENDVKTFFFFNYNLIFFLYKKINCLIFYRKNCIIVYIYRKLSKKLLKISKN